MGYNKDQVLDSLKLNRFNKISTLNYLLLKKKLRDGYSSPADINAFGFKPKMAQKFKDTGDLNYSSETRSKDKRRTNKSVLRKKIV
jgi:hypothetical protein